MKFCNYAIVFSEVPDQITLAINITNCPHKCKNCHSPYLREDIGTELTMDFVDNILIKYPCVTCICCMGGDRSHEEVKNFFEQIKSKYPNLLCGMYSGNDSIDETLIGIIDYYKIGHYDPEFGPINNRNTNQRMYFVQHTGNNNNVEDITYKFWETNKI